MTAGSTTIRREVRRGSYGLTRYIVGGRAGAIEYHAMPGQALGIEHHSPRPLHGAEEPSRDCDILEGPCYPDGSSMGAARLYARWLESGEDDEVIWRELETRYAEMEREAAER